MSLSVRIGVVWRREHEGRKYMEAEIHMPFLRPAKFRLHPTREAAPRPPYTLYLQPEHPTKGQKMITHNVGALWVGQTKKKEDCMSGYIASPALPSGRIELFILKARDEGAEHLYDVFLSEERRERETH